MKIAASIPSLGCRDVPEQCSVVVRVEQVRTARDRGHQEQGQRGQDELAVDQGPSQEQEHNGGAPVGGQLVQRQTGQQRHAGGDEVLPAGAVPHPDTGTK